MNLYIYIQYVYQNNVYEVNSNILMQKKGLKVRDFVFARCRINDIYTPAVIIRVIKNPPLYEVQFIDRNDNAFLQSQHLKIFDQKSAKQHKQELQEMMCLTYDKERISSILQAIQTTQQQIGSILQANSPKKQFTDQDTLINLNSNYQDNDFELLSDQDQPIPLLNETHYNKDKTTCPMMYRSKLKCQNKEKQLTLETSFQKIKLKLKKKLEENHIQSEISALKRRKTIEQSIQQLQITNNNKIKQQEEQQQLQSQISQNFIDIDKYEEQKKNKQKKHLKVNIQKSIIALQLNESLAVSQIDKPLQIIQKGILKEQLPFIKQQYVRNDEKDDRYVDIKQEYQQRSLNLSYQAPFKLEYNDNQSPQQGQQKYMPTIPNCSFSSSNITIKQQQIDESSLDSDQDPYLKNKSYNSLIVKIKVQPHHIQSIPQNIINQQTKIKQQQNLDESNFLNIYNQIDQPLNYDQLLITLPFVQLKFNQHKYPKEICITFVKECLTTMIRSLNSKAFNKELTLSFKQRQLLIAIMKSQNLDLIEMLKSDIVRLILEFLRAFQRQLKFKTILQLQYYAEYLIISVDLKYYIQFYQKPHNQSYLKNFKLEEKYNQLIQYYCQ